MARSTEVSTNSRFIMLASTCIVIAGLYLGREVLVPIALAVLLSFLLTPPVRWLERLRLPRTAATLIVVLIAMGFVGGLGYTVAKQLKSIVEEFPNYQGQARAKFQGIFSHDGFFKKAKKAAEEVTQPEGRSDAPAHKSTGQSGEHPATAQPTADNPQPVRIVAPPSSTWALIRDYASTVLSPLATTVIVLVFVIFMLLSREDLRDRVIRLLGHGRVNLTTQALDEASTRISSYLGALSIVNLCYATITALGLWLISTFLGHGHAFPNVIVWAILVGLFRYIPYAGIWIGAGVCLLLGFALFPGYGVFLGLLIMFASLEIVVAQFIEPMWYGSSTGMSALAVLVAAVFWAWLWGPVGLLLSTPMTVVLVVMGKYVPQLKFLDILLREEPVLTPRFRFYQRLIALDQEDAADIAEDYLKEKRSLQAVYDDLLVPALSMAEHDGHHERVADDQLLFVRQSVRDLVEELAEQYRTMPAAPVAAPAIANGSKNGEAPRAATIAPRPLPDGCKISVLCLPARDEADEIVALMLAQLLELRGYCVSTPTSDVLSAEMVDMVESRHIDAVCVSAMPPAAVAHARYLCKRLHARFPNIGTVVALWTLKGDLSKAKDRITCSPAVKVASTLRDAQEQLEQLLLPLIERAVSQPTIETDMLAPVA